MSGRLGTLLELAAGLAAVLLVTGDWAFDGGAGFAQRDAGFSAIGLRHLQDVLLRGADWREAPLGFPVPLGTTRTDWMFGEALLTLPMRLAGVDGTRQWVLVGLLGMLATAVVCQLLARALTGPGPHTVLAALIGGAGPVQLAHAQHANLVHHAPAALAGLLVAAAARSGSARLAGLAGLVAGLGFHFGVYMGLHAVAVLGLGMVVLTRTRAAWLAAGAGLLLGCATMAPVAALYRDATTTWGAQVDPGENMVESLDLAHAFGPSPGAPAHRGLLPPPAEGDRPPSDPPNPGYLVLLLAGVGIVVAARSPARSSGRRREWAAVGLVLLGAGALAVGGAISWDGRPTGLAGPHRLLDLAAGGNLRSPARWLALSQAALGLFAAGGLAALRLRRVPGVIVAGLAVGVAAAELPRAEWAPIASFSPPPAVPGLLAGFRDVPGPLYEVFGPDCECAGSARLRAALDHGRPLVGGNYARFFPAMQQVNRLLGSWPRPQAKGFLARHGVALVLEHPPLRGADPEGLRCATRDEHRLCAWPVEGEPRPLAPDEPVR